MTSYKEDFAEGQKKAEEAVKELRRTEFPGILSTQYGSLRNPDVKTGFLWCIAEKLLQN